MALQGFAGAAALATGGVEKLREGKPDRWCPNLCDELTPVNSAVCPVALCGSPGTAIAGSVGTTIPSRGSVDRDESLNWEKYGDGNRAKGFFSGLASPMPMPSMKSIKTDMSV